MRSYPMKYPILSVLCLSLMAASSSVNAEKKLLVDGELTPEISKAPHPKMTSEFFHLVQSLKAGSGVERARMAAANGVDGSPSPVVRLKGENRDIVETYIWLTSWDESVRQRVAKAGAEITGEDKSRYLLQAWIPLDRLEKIASIDGVRQLRRPSYGISAAGTIQTEGDTNLNTNFVRSIGRLTGNGINVGVISRGLFNSVLPVEDGGPFQEPGVAGANTDLRVSSGNLPAYPGGPDDDPISGYLGNVSVFPQTLSVHEISNGVDENTGYGTLEGTPMAEGAAILETIHDIAPDATLYYADGTTDVDVETGRNWLLSQSLRGKVDMIVDDMIFYDSGRYDGTSTVSRRAQQIALQDDVVYITAAGNFTPPVTTSDTGIGLKASRFPLFVNGHFSPRTGNSNTKFHNFAAGSTPGVRDESLTVRSQSGFIDVILVWDDIWDEQNPRASDDLDLYLVNVGDFTTLNPVASSTDVQNGFGRPIERITFPAPSAGNSYSLIISRKDLTNSAPTLFSLVILRGVVDATDIKYLTHGVAGNNGDALPPVISVGAIDAVKGVNNIAADSVPGTSPGPGRSFANDFVKWYTTQAVPAVVCYSNTDSFSSRSSTLGRFVGSSAAAAHVGGLVALLRHGYRQVPSFEFYDLLRDTDVDPTLPFPTATQILTEQLAVYQNAPKYLRVNGYDSYVNVGVGLESKKSSRSTIVSTYGASGKWEASTPLEEFNPPSFSESPMGIGLSPNGQQDVFGFWQTGLLELPDGNGGKTTELRTDRLYALKARVGTDESNPILVPDFRLRMTTGGVDESALLVIAGENANAANTPNTIGGKEYTLYYKPSNAEVAKQGIRFAFDLIHFDPKDNSNATLYLQEVSFSELELK